jgi:hypothetical protein
MCISIINTEYVFKMFFKCMGMLNTREVTLSTERNKKYPAQSYSIVCPVIVWRVQIIDRVESWQWQHLQSQTLDMVNTLPSSLYGKYKQVPKYFYNQLSSHTYPAPKINAASGPYKMSKSVTAPATV